MEAKTKMYIAWGAIGLVALCGYVKCQNDKNRIETQNKQQQVFRKTKVNPLITEVNEIGAQEVQTVSPYATEAFLAKMKGYASRVRSEKEKGDPIYTFLEEKSASEQPEPVCKQWKSREAEIKEVNDELERNHSEAKETFDNQLSRWESTAAEEGNTMAQGSSSVDIEKRIEDLIAHAERLRSKTNKGEAAWIGYNTDIRKLKRNLRFLHEENAKNNAQLEELARIRSIIIGEDNKIKHDSKPITEATKLLEEITNIGTYDLSGLAAPTILPEPPPPPFIPDISIVTTGDLASALVEPLVEAWLKERGATPLQGKAFMWDTVDERTRQIEVAAPDVLHGADPGKLRLRITTEQDGAKVFNHLRSGKEDADLVITGRKMNGLEEREWLPLGKELSEMDNQRGRTFRTRICSDALIFFCGNNMKINAIRSSVLQNTSKVFSTDDNNRAEVTAIFNITPGSNDILTSTKGKNINKIAAENPDSIILGTWHKDGQNRTNGQAIEINNTPTLSYMAGWDVQDNLKSADVRYISGDSGCAPSESTLNSGQYAFAYNVTAYRSTTLKAQSRLVADFVLWAGDVNNKKAEALVRTQGFVPVQAVEAKPGKLTGADIPIEPLLDRLEAMDFGYTRGISTWVYGTRIPIPLYYEVGSTTASNNGVAVDPDSQYYTEKQALQIIRNLVAQGKACLVLVGHADPQWGKKLNVSKESWNGNMNLSNKRADGVYTSLFQKACPDSATLKHITLGCSWARPASDISLSKDMAQQEHALSRCRRVEVFMVFPLTSECANN